ncbi:hypothetical protein ACFVP8_20280 [Viridibacillus arvi]|uniref:hypothetical protein n=1 Tax=Viridibacillus arvi TaxID=263475 RepID=UPI0036BC46F0
MEKNWAVECWGSFSGIGTELFYTKREAEAYFKDIRKGLDSSKYIMKSDKIVNIEDDGNMVCLTDLCDN